MRIKEIKKTVEQVVRMEYVAEDGIVFHLKEECEKYEESALFAISKQLKRLNTKELSVYSLIDEGSEDYDMEIFDIQTEDDIILLKRYIYLQLIKYNSDEWVNKCLDTQFSKVTCGHEVILCWNYEKDYAWTYEDGSLNGLFEHIRKRYEKCLEPEEE